MSGPDDERWAALEGQAEAWFRARNPDRLADVAGEMIEYDVDHPLGYRYTGDAWLQRGDLKQATHWFRKALELDPQDDFMHFRMAIVYRSRGRYARADEHIQEAIRLDPEYADYWAEQAEICHMTDDERGMNEALDTALELEPDNAEALHLRARAASGGGAGSRRDAIDYYRAALEAEPEDATIHHNLGRALLDARRIEEAEEHLLAAVRMDPTDGDFRRGYYEVLKKRSLFYRCLRWPGEAIMRMWRAFGRIPIWAWVILVVAGVVRYLVGFAIAVSILWVLLLWPPLLAYNALVISDIKARASEVGARRGFHALPRWFRMAIFGVFSVGLWVGLYHVFTGEHGGSILVWIVIVGFGAYVLAALVGLYFLWRDWRINRRRRKALAEL